MQRRHGVGGKHAIGAILRASRPDAPAESRDPRALSFAQLTRSNLQMLLRFEDRNSMAHSIESRVPFLDHRLVEFALGLPDEFKLGGGVTKRVLREAMRGVVPDAVRDRVDKLAFETPEASWIRDGRPWFRHELGQAIERSNSMIPASVIDRFEAMADGRRAFDRGPWRAISLGRWMQTFDVAAPSRTHSPT